MDSNRESFRKKMIGKSYSGKLNVRFAEGELEIGHRYYASSLLYLSLDFRTCSRQIHMLFSENELVKMTLEGLLQTEAMKKYLDWIKKRKGDFKVRLSKRLREKR